MDCWKMVTRTVNTDSGLIVVPTLIAAGGRTNTSVPRSPVNE